jgi:hypothetical protein
MVFQDLGGNTPGGTLQVMITARRLLPMKGKAHIPLAILAVSLIMVGCGKDRNAVQTSVRSQGRLQAAKTAGHANRVLFGLWKISISADRTSAQVTPYRTGPVS